VQVLAARQKWRVQVLAVPYRLQVQVLAASKKSFSPIEPA
jgi:hypothetical protein